MGTHFQSPMKGNGWQECLVWAAGDSQANVGPSGKAWEALSCHHVKTGRNTLRHIWCLLRAVSAWGLYELIGKQILPSPLISSVSWHEVAGQHIPELQLGMETSKSCWSTEQSMMCNTYGHTSVCIAGEVILAYAFGPWHAGVLEWHVQYGSLTLGRLLRLKRLSSKPEPCLEGWLRVMGLKGLWGAGPQPLGTCCSGLS